MEQKNETKVAEAMRRENRRRAIACRIPFALYNRIHGDVVRAQMCSGLDGTDQAMEIGIELCHFIADELENARAEEAVNVHTHTEAEVLSCDDDEL